MTVPSPKLINLPHLHLHHSKILLNSFPMNGHTLGFYPKSPKLESFVSPKVLLWSQRVKKTTALQTVLTIMWLPLLILAAENYEDICRLMRLFLVWRNSTVWIGIWLLFLWKHSSVWLRFCLWQLLCSQDFCLQRWDSSLCQQISV